MPDDYFGGNERLGLISSVIIAICIVFVAFLIYMSFAFFFIHDEYDSQAVLHNQFVGSGCCCEACLILNVTEFDCRGAASPHGCKWKDRYLCFENEHKLNADLHDESEIIITYRWSKSVDDYLIRGVEERD